MSVKIVKFDEIYSPEIIQIRTSVFVKEQKIDFDIDFDGNDELAIHVLVYEGKKAVGTARLLDDGHIGRMAVLKNYRKLGKGSKALAEIIAEARRIDMKSVFLGAQLTAVGFYEKIGFSSRGKTFLEAGISHVEMELDL